ncbi:MAG: TIGR01244 family sulfur transferase [Pseudomonadota bacterium]|nr:TIGR01244 family sulfur transferase [Pseudomonadota bacterium]
MIIRQLTAELSVADQLTMDDLEAVKEAGFKAVICNRPDEEGEPHADADSMAQKANALGLEFRYLPVNGANITDTDVAQHGALLSEVPGPILTYCRSGARCAKLWALSEAGKQDVDTLIETVDKAGLSIVDIAHRLS